MKIMRESYPQITQIPPIFHIQPKQFDYYVSA